MGLLLPAAQKGPTTHQCQWWAVWFREESVQGSSKSLPQRRAWCRGPPTPATGQPGAPGALDRQIQNGSITCRKAHTGTVPHLREDSLTVPALIWSHGPFLPFQTGKLCHRPQPNQEVSCIMNRLTLIYHTHTLLCITHTRTHVYMHTCMHSHMHTHTPCFLHHNNLVLNWNHTLHVYLQYRIMSFCCKLSARNQHQTLVTETCALFVYHPGQPHACKSM